MKKLLLVLSLFFTCLICGLMGACGAKSYSYVFETNGGVAIDTVEKGDGEEFTLPVPERDGYIFDGWYLSNDFSGESVGSITCTESSTFYAKWTKLYAVTLNLDGGTLTASAPSLKVGDVIYDAVKDLVPTKSGYEFGGWFVGDTELAHNTRMTEARITLTAKYKVEYSLQIWQQNETLDGYTLAETVKGYEYSGTDYVAEYTVNGFSEVENEGTVSSLKISDKPSENLLKLYFDRVTYQITFVSNFPDGSTAQNSVLEARYGVSITFPADLTCEGYLLRGWSTRADGDVEYAVDAIGNLLYNSDGKSNAKENSVLPERNTAYYAVWQKGISDLFGGDDYLFIIDDDSKTTVDIYLNRGDVYYLGSYKKSTKEFWFEITDSKELEGKVNNSTFVYYAESRDGRTAYLYNSATGTDKNTYIVFDGFDGVTYTQEIESEVKTSKGTFTIDNNDYLIVTFTEGELAGQTKVMQTSFDDNDDSESIFRMKDETLTTLGELDRFVVASGTIIDYSSRTSKHYLSFDGFGGATIRNGSTNYSYSYVYDEAPESTLQLSINNSSGTTELVVRIVEINGVKGWMSYDEQYDRTITSSDGATLTLDGLYQATYKKGDSVENGKYSSSTSYMGGIIVTFTNVAGTTKVFLVSANSDQYENITDTNQSTTYSFEQKGIGYAEYYYLDGSLKNAPFITLEDNPSESGSASVYEYSTATSSYIKASSGIYTQNQTTGLYIYSATQYYPCNVTTVYDLSKVKSFMFGLGTYTSSSQSVNVSYWYRITLDGEEDEIKFVEYTSSNRGSLVLVGGYAIYSENGSTAKGQYSVNSSNDSILRILVNGQSSNVIYVEIDRTAHTFVTLSTLPYTSYARQTNGTLSTTESLSFDGNGGATYTNDQVSVAGTITATSETLSNGSTVYTFTANDNSVTFKYIPLTVNSQTSFEKEDTSLSHVYRSEQGVLIVYGYGFATFTTSAGVSVTAFIYRQDNTIVMSATDRVYYFDVSGDSFNVKGEEYGTYSIIENQLSDNTVVFLDGYGKAKVYIVNGSNAETIDENATYEISGKSYTIHYTSGNEQVTLSGIIRDYSSAKVFFVENKNVVKTYVNQSDWSVLLLDAYGKVVKYSETGVKENGNYLLITDSLLYYYNDEGTDAALFNYNNTAGTMTPITYTEHAYYTQDLRSLRFTKYGFVIINGTERAYYLFANGNVTIYSQDSANKNANKYGFVAENFGAFDDTKTYNGETYYYNSGYTLTFNRSTSNTKDYAFKLFSGTENTYYLSSLVFTPTGTSEFSVTGKATFSVAETADNKGVATYTGNCTVTRSADQNGKIETYVKFYYYRYEINLSYTGLNKDGTTSNSFSVSGLKNVTTYSSYKYVYNYLSAYYGQGQSAASKIENNYGEITLSRVYHADGTHDDAIVSAWFGEDSGMYDLDGNLISFQNGEYHTSTYNYISFTADDGYTYHLYFGIYNVTSSYSGYIVLALVRYQKLTDAESGYYVNVGRIVNTESTGIEVGTVFSIAVGTENESEDESVIKQAHVYTIGGELYYFLRTLDNNSKVTETKCYRVQFVDGDSNREDDKQIVPLYASVTVTPVAVTPYYTQDGLSFAEIGESGVIYLSVDGVEYTDLTSTYENGVYTVTSNGKTFTVKIGEGVAEITEVD